MTIPERLPPVLFRLVAGIVALALVGLAGLAVFPWGMLKGRIEARLSQSIGRPVSIGAMERVDTVSFHPRVRLRSLRIPQPAWVTLRLDDLARIDQVELRFSAWSLLTGHVSVEQADVRGADVQFYRTATGRKNWTDGQGGHSRGDLLRMLHVADSRLRYLDEKRKRSLDVAVAADGQGLRVNGSGLIDGHGVRITGRGAPVIAGNEAKPWPYSLDIEGPAVGFAITGTMPAPLDLDHLRGQARGHASDLKLLDAIIEAGLPGTQPVRLTARIQRDWPDWTIESLSGTIGRSDIAGHATIVKRNGRNRITGALWADRFDIGDLSSDQGKQRAAAQKARLGPRVIPGSAIDLAHVVHTDGTLDLRVDHLLWPGTSPFRSLKAHLSLERSRLVLNPLSVGMTHGTFAGRLAIDQTDPRQKDPLLDLDMTMRGARLLDFFPRAQIDGGLIARMAMTGRGHTMRDAFGRGHGTVALVGRDGRIPAKTAALLGQDVGRGITAGKDDMASLRCLVVRLDVRGGVARPAPVVIDSSRAQTRVTGSIDLSDERLMLTLKGAPKSNSLLRLPGAIPIAGTIKTPDIRVPPKVKSVGGVLGMVASAIVGKQEPLAQDADCDGLARQALR